MASNKKTTDKKEEMLRLCSKLGVNKLYYNTRGEYFTQKNYAVLSEGGNAKKVSEFEKTDTDTVETVTEAGKENKQLSKQADKAKVKENPLKEVKNEQQGNDQ